MSKFYYFMKYDNFRIFIKYFLLFYLFNYREIFLFAKPIEITIINLTNILHICYINNLQLE